MYRCFDYKKDRLVIMNHTHLGYEADLSQAESRIVAVIAPEPTMIHAFETGIDIHSLTGAGIGRVMIPDLTIEEVQRQHKEKIPALSGMTWRHIGKTSNHAFAYGLGAEKFADKNEMSLEDAAFVRQNWHDLYPGIQKYWSWVEYQLKQTHSITNCFGTTYRVFGRLTDASTLMKAYNFIPQSTVAEKINRHGMIPMYTQQDIFGPVTILNQVHDSIWFQIPLSLGAKRHVRILTALKESLEQPLVWKMKSFSIPLDIKMGTNFGVMTDVKWDASVEEQIAKKIEEVLDGATLS